MRTSSGATPIVESAARAAGWGRLHLAVLATALAAAAGGCGSGDSSSASSDAVSEFGQQKFTEVRSSPLAEYFGYGDVKNQEAQAREQEKKQQEIIAACMREQGFEYIPFFQSGTYFDGQDSFSDLTREEFAAKWGFGISTTMSASGEPVEGSPYPGVELGGDDDPNQKIRDGLGEAERAAYEKALYGAGDGFTGSPPSEGEGESVETGEVSSEGSFSPDFETMGCQGKAFGSQSGLDSEGEEELQEAFEELSRRLEADARVKSATARFRACMAAAGYPEMKKPEDVYEKVSERMGELYDSAEGSSPVTSEEEIPQDQDPGEEESSEGSSLAPGPGPGGPVVNAAKLKEVQRYELAVAKAEFPCRAVFTLATEKVQAEYEEEFLAENKALLDKSKAAGGPG